MTTKEYLSQAYRLDQRIQSKQEQVASLNELAESCTAAMSGMPGSPNRGSTKMSDAVCKILDLEDSIAADMNALIILKAEIIKSIKEVEGVDYQLILEKRYICGKSWPEIAVDMGYKMRWLFKMHDEALKRVKIPENYKSVQYKPL